MWRWDGGQAQAAPQRRMSDLSARPSVVELPSVPDRPAVVAVALAVVSEALRRPLASPTAAGTLVADLVRLPSQIWVILGLVACDQDLRS